MIDIRRTALSDKRELAGLEGTLRLPEEAMAVKKTTAVNRSTNSHILIYNRVPKCGSTTVGGVLKDISRRNNFSFHFSTNYWSQVLSPNEEEDLVEQLTKMGENGPVIYDRHFFTLDIVRQQDNNFEWVNFIREPVS